MKISNQNIFIFRDMKTPKQKQTNFKGWAACPLESIILKPDDSREFKFLIEELKKKCGKYFDIHTLLLDRLIRNNNQLQYDAQGAVVGKSNGIWVQDYGVFTNSRSIKKLMWGKQDWHNYNFSLGDHLKIESQETWLPLEGGNLFFGEKPDGETYAIIGADSFKNIEQHALMDHFSYKCLRERQKNEIVKFLGIKFENLHEISQPDFHIDMAIRPLIYPYVLVGDPDLTMGLAKRKYSNHIYEPDTLYQMDNRRTPTAMNNGYATPDEIVQQLRGFGFNSIKVPGILGHPYEDLNYMNAIVHQDSDGKLVYITNKNNRYKKEYGIDFERIFIDYIKEHVPSIKRIIFIDVDGYMEDMLLGRNGGLHCFSLEHPDFKKMKALSKRQNIPKQHEEQVV